MSFDSSKWSPGWLARRNLDESIDGERRAELEWLETHREGHDFQAAEWDERRMATHGDEIWKSLLLMDYHRKRASEHYLLLVKASDAHDAALAASMADAQVMARSLITKWHIDGPYCSIRGLEWADPSTQFFFIDDDPCYRSHGIAHRLDERLRSNQQSVVSCAIRQAMHEHLVASDKNTGVLGLPRALSSPPSPRTVSAGRRTMMVQEAISRCKAGAGLITSVIGLWSWGFDTPGATRGIASLTWTQEVVGWPPPRLIRSPRFVGGFGRRTMSA